MIVISIISNDYYESLWICIHQKIPQTLEIDNRDREKTCSATPSRSSCTLELSPPKSALPHVTTEPSARSAANAPEEALICWTPDWPSRFWTAEMSPPHLGLPHVTILRPPQHHRAKAFSVAAIFGCCASTVRLSPSWTPAASKEFMGSKGSPAAVTSCRKRCPNEFWANILRCPTVEDSGTSRLSFLPLGNATSTRSIGKSHTNYVSVAVSSKNLEPKSAQWTPTIPPGQVYKVSQATRNQGMWFQDWLPQVILPMFHSFRVLNFYPLPPYAIEIPPLDLMHVTLMNGWRWCQDPQKTWPLRLTTRNSSVYCMSPKSTIHLTHFVSPKITVKHINDVPLHTKNDPASNHFVECLSIPWNRR